jgi:hypothetical protein
MGGLIDLFDDFELIEYQGRARQGGESRQTFGFILASKNHF